MKELKGHLFFNGKFRGGVLKLRPKLGGGVKVETKILTTLKLMGINNGPILIILSWGAIIFSGSGVLQSAVGMAHVLRSRLAMGYTTSYFQLIVLGYCLDSNRWYGPLSDTL